MTIRISLTLCLLGGLILLMMAVFGYAESMLSIIGLSLLLIGASQMLITTNFGAAREGRSFFHEILIVSSIGVSAGIASRQGERLVDWLRHLVGI